LKTQWRTFEHLGLGSGVISGAGRLYIIYPAYIAIHMRHGSLRSSKTFREGLFKVPTLSSIPLIALLDKRQFPFSSYNSIHASPQINTGINQFSKPNGLHRAAVLLHSLSAKKRAYSNRWTCWYKCPKTHNARRARKRTPAQQMHRRMYICSRQRMVQKEKSGANPRD